MIHPTEREFEEIYSEHFDVLVRLGVSQFSLSVAEAKKLVHDVMLASLARSSRISDLEQWLAGALACAVRQQGGEQRA